MAFDAALQPSESTAAFERFLEQTEDEFKDTGPDSDDSQTPDDADNSSDDQDNTDLDDQDQDDQDDADDADQDADDQDDQDDADDADTESPIDTIEGLAEHFEVEPQQVLENLMVDGLDGEEVPIGEALDSWRESEGTLASRTTELESGFAERTTTFEAEVNQQMVTLNGLSQGMIDLLRRSYAPDHLAEIKIEDPARYADLVIEKQGVEKMILGAIAEGEAIAKTRGETSQQAVEELLAKENVKLLKAKPEWRDGKVRKKAMTAAGRYLTKYGKFTEKEISDITDHRILVIVADAVAGRRVRSGSSGKNIENLKKRGLRRPSTGLRSSSRREPANSRNQARQVNMARLKKSGRAEDAVGLLMEHIED